MSKPDRVILRVDRTRRLPETDPFSRQITIGLGCFLELLRMAAAEDGYVCSIAPFPEGSDPSRLDDRIVAHVTFTKYSTPKPDPLFRHVLTRRSLKVPFDTSRALKPETLAEIIAVADTPQSRVGSIYKAAEIADWRKLTRRALDIELTTQRTYKESVNLFRISSRSSRYIDPTLQQTPARPI